MHDTPGPDSSVIVWMNSVIAGNSRDADHSITPGGREAVYQPSGSPISRIDPDDSPPRKPISESSQVVQQISVFPVVRSC
jgi:hypothetical protein